MDQKTVIAKLDAAWEGVEKAINTLGALIRNDPLNNEPVHRYESYKTVLALLAESYIDQVHYDRKRPECLPFIGSLINCIGPTPDFIYRIVHLEPGASYRVWGRRGDAELIDLQQMAGWFGQYKEKRSTVTVANELFDSKGIQFDAQGNFDFILSPDQQGGQWIKLGERVTTLLIREYFTDYAAQDRSSIFHFDRLDAKDQGSTVLGIDESLDRLGAYANSLRDYTFSFFLPTQVHAQDGDNVFRELNFGADGGASDQHYLETHFNIKPDEALIGKWTVPAEYLYWSAALYNDSNQMLNYANRQICLNHAQAKVGSDRTFYFVLSHRDPGIANWLDPDGHEQGVILMRIKGTTGAVELPSLTQVPAAEVLKHLPKDIALVNASERARELSVRRRHFQMREGR